LNSIVYGGLPSLGLPLFRYRLPIGWPTDRWRRRVIHCRTVEPTLFIPALQANEKHRVIPGVSWE